MLHQKGRTDSVDGVGGSQGLRVKVAPAFFWRPFTKCQRPRGVEYEPNVFIGGAFFLRPDSGLPDRTLIQEIQCRRSRAPQSEHLGEEPALLQRPVNGRPDAAARSNHNCHLPSHAFSRLCFQGYAGQPEQDDQEDKAASDAALRRRLIWPVTISSC